MDDLLAEFLTKADASIARLDGDVLHLEEEPADPELLRRIFAEFHTIKADCSFIGLTRLEALAYAAEKLIEKFRGGELVVTPEGVSLVLESVDAIEGLVASLTKREEEPQGDDSDLIGCLNTMAEGKNCLSPRCSDTRQSQDETQTLNTQENKESDDSVPQQERKMSDDRLKKDSFTDDIDALCAEIEKLTGRMNQAKASRSEKFQMLEKLIENLGGTFTAQHEELTACKERFDHLQHTNRQFSNLIKEMIDPMEEKVKEKYPKPIIKDSEMVLKWNQK